jgi:hypothetical protein
MKQPEDTKTIDMWAEDSHCGNLVEQALVGYWGERCPKHEDGCLVCEAWKQYDNMAGETK